MTLFLVSAVATAANTELLSFFLHDCDVVLVVDGVTRANGFPMGVENSSR